MRRKLDPTYDPNPAFVKSGWELFQNTYPFPDPIKNIRIRNPGLYIHFCRVSPEYCNEYIISSKSNVIINELICSYHENSTENIVLWILYIYIYILIDHKNNVLCDEKKSLIGVICNEFDAPWKYGVLFKPFDCGRASIFAAITNLK